MEAEIKDNLPVMSGKLGNKNVKVLRGSGCNGVIAKRELVDEVDLYWESGLHDDGKSNTNKISHCKD